MGNVEMLKRFEEARKHEELSRTFEKERKNVFRNDLKNDMHRHSQVNTQYIPLCLLYDRT